jgi:hypothetical protein
MIVRLLWGPVWLKTEITLLHEAEKSWRKTNKKNSNKKEKTNSAKNFQTHYFFPLDVTLNLRDKVERVGR